jgi:hypothetical protein
VVSDGAIGGEGGGVAGSQLPGGVLIYALLDRLSMTVLGEFSTHEEAAAMKEAFVAAEAVAASDLAIHPDLAPGQSCPTCERRMPYPKKEGKSPETIVKSFRLPADDSAAFGEGFSRACLTVGITSQHKFPIYKFLDFIIDAILSEPERWEGAYTRGEL